MIKNRLVQISAVDQVIAGSPPLIAVGGAHFVTIFEVLRFQTGAAEVQ